jgi:GNAT superfamily N-acetyltransferase
VNTAPIALVEFRESSPTVLREVVEVMGESPFYYRTCYGRTANGDDAAHFFTKVVPGLAPGDERSFGIYAGYSLVGIAHLALGWKRPGQSMVGLLLVSERQQGRGHARSAYAQLEAIVRASPHGISMRIGVCEANAPAFGFWRHVGFRENGERFKVDDLTSDVLILEKELVPAA